MKKRRADHGKKRVNVQQERRKRIAARAKRVAAWREAKAEAKKQEEKKQAPNC